VKLGACQVRGRIRPLVVAAAFGRLPGRLPDSPKPERAGASSVYGCHSFVNHLEGATCTVLQLPLEDADQAYGLESQEGAPRTGLNNSSFS
jgi:hypothetical protein